MHRWAVEHPRPSARETRREYEAARRGCEWEVVAAPELGMRDRSAQYWEWAVAHRCRAAAGGCGGGHVSLSLVEYGP